jgi:ATP-dependent RNA helicase DDX56/DBP9
VLVPTKELSEQVTAHIRGLVKYCDSDVAITNVAASTTTHIQKFVLSTSATKPS